MVATYQSKYPRVFGSLICLGLLLVLQAGVIAADTASIAVVVKASGEVMLRSSSGGEETDLKSGMRLNDGDQIRTGEEGRAVLVYTDDRSQIKMLPETQLVLHARRTQNRVDKEVNLNLGTIWSKVTRQQGEFVVATPTSVASVKGTAWWTKLDETGLTTIITEEGLVGLRNLKTGEDIDVPMGSTGESIDESLVVRTTAVDDTEGLERGEIKTARIPITDGDQSRTLIIEYYE
jgi:hypothetical protein